MKYKQISNYQHIFPKENIWEVFPPFAFTLSHRLSIKHIDVNIARKKRMRPIIETLCICLNLAPMCFEIKKLPIKFAVKNIKN